MVMADNDLCPKPREAVVMAEEALGSDLLTGVDNAGAVATLAAAIMIRSGLKIVAQTIDTYDKNEQERAAARG